MAEFDAVDACQSIKEVSGKLEITCNKWLLYKSLL